MTAVDRIGKPYYLLPSYKDLIMKKLPGKFKNGEYHYKAVIDFTKIRSKKDLDKAVREIIKEKILFDKWKGQKYGNKKSNKL